MSAAINLPSLSERFWRNVRKSPDESGCWDWTGGTVKGLPRFHPSKYLHESARRFALAEAGIAVPANKQVRPWCGNRLCVRPEHLRIGMGPNTVPKSPGAPRKKPGPVARKVDRELPKFMPERPRIALLPTVAICMCGKGRAEHRAFKGSCAETGCPEFMERGK